MIDYATFCELKRLAKNDKLNAAQISEVLGINVATVKKWLACEKYHARSTPQTCSKLDSYKDDIVRQLERHPYSAQQLFQQISEAGYTGSYSLVKQYVHRVRPKRAPAFLTLSFEPGEAAQVDWGVYGTVNVGKTRRQLSFFVMVLCYSRMMYVEFTVSQTMEHFLQCHHNAFAAFGLVPKKVMVDNLKSAVLKRQLGNITYNPHYVDFAQHYGFTIAACNVRAGNEKGRVESGVGYVKKNFLNGLEMTDFSMMNPAAKVWLDQIANCRQHGETHERPLDRYDKERQHAQAVPLNPFDVGIIYQVQASNRFRVAFDANRYSVPAEYASQRLTLKAYPDRVCIYTQQSLIARHDRSYDRHQDITEPDHERELLKQRKTAKEQLLMKQFLALSPKANQYYEGMQAKRFNARHHARQIVALSEIHGRDNVARALEDALVQGAFSSEYICNILASLTRKNEPAGALHLARSGDYLAIELDAPDLEEYDFPVTDSVALEDSK
jgi:transposase